MASCSGAGGSSSTTTSTSPTTTSTSPTTTTAAASGGLATCPVGDLTLKILGTGGAAGTIEVTMGFRNSSTTTCFLTGYPGAQMLDSSGRPITTSVARGGSYSFTNFAPSRVTVPPGATAYFNAGYSDVPSGTESSCPTSAQIGVTPPNDFTQLVVAFQATVCNGGHLVFSPVFGAGSAGSQTTAPPST